MEETQKPDLSALRIRREPSGETGGTARPRRRRLWPWVLAVAVVLAAAIGLVRVRTQAVPVRTAVVERLVPGAAGSLLTATGYVVAQRQAAVASKGTGRLEVLNVEEGDQVKRGEVIGRLEAADVEASLRSARAAVGQAEAELERTRALAKEAQLAFDRAQGLLERSLIAQSEYEAAEARHRTAEAAVTAAGASLASKRAEAALAAVQVENTYIRAPFDGTVLTKNADVGEVVAPFASSSSSRGAVVTLADMSSLEVEADVSESNIRRIGTGQPCLITLDAHPSEPYRGVVKKIVPTADRAKATVLTKIAFVERDARVLPEMSAKVSFLDEGADSAASGTVVSVIAAPAAAIRETDGGAVAFVVRDGTVAEVAVEAGTRYGGAVEIRRGLEEGDIVVLDPPQRLRDGSRVKTGS
jgi:RND family efflux transporter MFP subunit